MNAPIVRGWCPGALKPMASGDGLVVRIRTPMDRLEGHQAIRIGELARTYGNGEIDLSARANLQLRGVSETGHPPLIEGLAALGLIDASPEAERRRNIVVTPFWQENDDSHAIASALIDALAADDAPDLSAKFGFAVDCGHTPVLGETSADIRIERSPNGCLICRADGMETGRPVTRATAAGVAVGLARWFIESGGLTDGRGRMAGHIAARCHPGDEWTAEHAARPSPITFRPGPSPAGRLVALEFGRLRAETLMALGATGPIRLTPWRMLLLEGRERSGAIAGLIDDPDDPRLNVFACTGAPDCPQALAKTRPLARALASALDDGATLHVSGCAKGCALPKAADVTLVATGRDRFDLIPGGRASDRPSRTGLSARTLLARPHILKETP